MKIIRWGTLLTILLCTGGAFAAEGEGQGGNGGGTICIGDNECITLAEAGLRIKEETDDFFRLPAPLFLKVKEILKESNLFPETQQKLYKRVLGNTTTFVPVETIDPKRLEAIQKKYQKTIEKIDPDFDVSNLQIDAWSGNGWDPRTFLLPSFFELSLERQAYILIHEANVRGISHNSPLRFNRLKEALKFDIFLREMVNDSDPWSNQEFDHVGLARVLKELDLKPKHLTVTGALLKHIQLNHGARPLRLDQLCETHLYPFTYCDFSYEKLLSLYDIDPRLAIFFEKKMIVIVDGRHQDSLKLYPDRIAPSGHWFRYHPLQDGGDTFARYAGICAEHTHSGNSWDLQDFYFIQDLTLSKFFDPDGYLARRDGFGDLWLLHCSRDKESEVSIPNLMYVVVIRHSE